MVPASPSAATEHELSAEQHLEQLQRMAMLGTLAAGIGHDLRNLVMPILLRLDVLAASNDMPERSRVELASIRDIVTHLQRLAGGLRLLSSDPNRQQDAPQFTRLDEWWREVHVVVTDALTPKTILSAELPESLPTAAIPPDVLAQVVVNIVMNARRAMDRTANPSLRISARVREQCVFIDISDNGSGMDAETRQRCFEPYFTTQSREFATGLGLSTGRALLKRYHGDLTVASASGNGTTFTIHMPIARTSDTQTNVRRARIQIGDPRLRALLRMIVANRGFEEVRQDEFTDGNNVDFVICDAASLPEVARQRNAITARAVQSNSAAKRSSDETVHDAFKIVAVGVPQASDASEGVIWIGAQDISRLTDILA